MDLVWCWEKLAMFLWADTQSAAETGAGQSSLSLRLCHPQQERAPLCKVSYLKNVLKITYLQW